MKRSTLAFIVLKKAYDNISLMKLWKAIEATGISQLGSKL